MGRDSGYLIAKALTEFQARDPRVKRVIGGNAAVIRTRKHIHCGDVSNFIDDPRRHLCYQENDNMFRKRCRIKRLRAPSLMFSMMSW